MTRVGVSGAAGRMGRLVAEAVAAAADLELVAAYDPAGRLAAVSYANDALTVNYTYDAQTGLLRTVSDSLTGTAVEFQYDGDFRLTLINLPGGEEIRYTWDAASRLTRLRSGRRVDFEYTRDAAGRVTGVAAVTPLTVPRVPTGMNIGVDTVPCAVSKDAARAAVVASVACTVKSKRVMGGF